MIRAIVVDDEPYIRKSIKTSIENTHSSFKVIAEAANGIKAYDLITSLNPDVVFLDIRMPIMDGIALLDKLYVNNIHPIRVILSGFSEFEYAKKAIHYGVFDYVLKPIHMDQLSDLLNNIAERFLQKKSKDESEYLHYVFKGITPSIPLEQLSLSMRCYREYYCFYIIVGSYMYTPNNQFNPARDFWNSDSLSLKVSNLCSGSGQLWTIPGGNQNETLLIIGSHTLNEHSAVHLASQIFELFSVTVMPVTLAYSPDSASLDNIKDVVARMKSAAIQNIKFGFSSLIMSDSGNAQSKSFVSGEKMAILNTIIREKRYHDFKHSVKLLLEFYKQKQILQRQLKVELIRILEIMQGNYLSHEVQDFIGETITNTFTYNDLTGIILQYIDDYSKDYYHSLSQSLTENICDYIDENYESQLTLKEIAAQFHISPSYLSTLFKKAYAVTPNEYIMNKRISKAKDLLVAFPPISIKQVALTIGYTDSFYFSRIFKTLTSQTPTEYRMAHYDN